MGMVEWSGKSGARRKPDFLVVRRGGHGVSDAPTMLGVTFQLNRLGGRRPCDMGDVLLTKWEDCSFLCFLFLQLASLRNVDEEDIDP